MPGAHGAAGRASDEVAEHAEERLDRPPAAGAEQVVERQDGGPLLGGDQAVHVGHPDRQGGRPGPPRRNESSQAVGAARARDCAKTPVYVWGAGEATEHVMLTQMKNLTTSEATRMSGAKAFAMAGVGPSDFDHIMLYDAFTSGPPIMLESLGFCKPGEGVHLFEPGRSTPGGTRPINTNGGGLSYTHSGMYGIFPIIEAARQLRAECGPRQVPNCTVSLVNGMGGMLSAAGTLVLSSEP